MEKHDPKIQKRVTKRLLQEKSENTSFFGGDSGSSKVDLFKVVHLFFSEHAPSSFPNPLQTHMIFVPSRVELFQSFPSFF